MSNKKFNPSLAYPLGPPFKKFLISIVENENFNENCVKFDFRMGTVFVIFSFF